MTKYESLVERKVKEYGDKFCTDELEPKFIPYFNSGERIKVDIYGRAHYGTVSVTTGWRPVFLLMRSRNQLGSSDVLDWKCEIVGKQVGKVYIGVSVNG